jgi:hypothetical protein
MVRAYLSIAIKTADIPSGFGTVVSFAYIITAAKRARH